MSENTGKLQLLKVYGITNLNMDIIFISDIRVCSRKMVSRITAIKNALITNCFGQYRIIFNSTSNKHCVGIPFKTNLNFSEILRPWVRNIIGSNYGLVFFGDTY
jgi:hypothetical protein